MPHRWLASRQVRLILRGEIGSAGQRPGNSHFFLTEHDGKLLRLAAGGDVVCDNPGPFEGDNVEEPERGDCDNDRTGRETSFPRQVEQIRPDFRWPEKLW